MRLPRRAAPRAWVGASVIAPLLGVALGAGRPAQADAQCRPPASSHEARLLAFYAAPLAFSPATAPAPVRAWSVRVGVEGAPVPVPDAALQQTGFCYQRTTQSTRLAPFFGRPRVTVGLPAGLTVEGSYLPPITVAGATPALVSVALAHTQQLPGSGGRGLLTLRLHGTTGTVRGAITCARDRLQLTDAGAPCYGTGPSRDTFHPDMYGGEALAEFPLARDRVRLYGGVGLSQLRPGFQVGFTDAGGVHDATEIRANLTRGTVLGGITARLTSVADLTAQLYAVPADVMTWRIGAGYRFH